MLRNKYLAREMEMDYTLENKLDIDIESISNELYFFTNGYPYLVSRLCQIIDEKINIYEKDIFAVYV